MYLQNELAFILRNSALVQHSELCNVHGMKENLSQEALANEGISNQTIHSKSSESFSFETYLRFVLCIKH